MNRRILSSLFGGIFIFFTSIMSVAQNMDFQNSINQKDNYHIGEEKNLEIMVHIWGEVKKTGEIRVQDGTNILELISKADGPTEYSDLSRVILFRDMLNHAVLQNDGIDFTVQEDFIKNNYLELAKTGKTEININKYLAIGKAGLLPRLMPGDVVQVKRNIWHKWQVMIRVASQLAIIAQVWYWYSKSN